MFIRLLMLLFLLIAPLFSKVLLQDDKTIYDDFTIEYFYDKTGLPYSDPLLTQPVPCVVE